MDYMPSVMQQTVSFVYSSGLGFCFGLLYDFFGIIFYLFTGNDKKLSVPRDIIYMFFCLTVHFIFVLVMCSGQIQMFTVVGEIAGLTAYFKTLSGYITVPLKKIIVMLRRLFIRLLSFIKKFILKISELFQIPLKKVKK